ncbi:hypothetical protein NLO98_11950 [Pseudomonas syringae]|nr:hypothetical protein [Pseudomonas syringae]
MGMRDEIQAELAEAFDDPDGLADAVKPVQGSRQETGVYDPDSGKTISQTTIYTGRGVFGTYIAKEIDGSLIQTTDEKLLILQNELFVSQGGIATVTLAEPKSGDVIAGKRVLTVGQDPAGATWTVQLRK